MNEAERQAIEKAFGKAPKEDKTPTPRTPRISITQVEINALKRVLKHYMSTWHYHQCQWWKECQRVHRNPENDCHCSDFKEWYPNSDIVSDNVSSLLKKLESVVK